MKPALLCLGLLLLCACRGEQQEVAVSPGKGGAFEPALAVSSHTAVVAWHDNRSGVDQIYLRRYDHGLFALGTEQRLTSGSDPAYEADVALLDENIAVTWYEVKRDGRAVVRLGLWDPQGQPLWLQSFTAASGRARIPVLLAQDQRLFLAWVEDAALKPASPPLPSTLRYTWLDSDGMLLQAPVALAPLGYDTWNLNATVLADGEVALVYDAGHATRAKELYLSLATPAAPTWRLSSDDGVASVYPDLAAHDNTLALTWFDETGSSSSDVKLRLFSRDILKSDTELDLDHAALAVTATPGESIGAYLTWSGAVLGLAWNDNSSGQHELYFQAFDTGGSALSKARRLSHTRRASLIPAISAVPDGFLLSWSEVALKGHDTTQATVMLRRVPAP